MRSPLEDTQDETRLKDLAQIIIGAGTLALPVAMSTDTWERLIYEWSNRFVTSRQPVLHQAVKHMIREYNVLSPALASRALGKIHLTT